MAFSQPTEGTVVEPNRDRWGRPLIQQLDGSEAVAYTRVTTVAKALDDTTQLDKWKQRQVVIGMGLREDLVSLAASCDPGDKKTLNDIAWNAQKAASSDKRANMGTALHKYTERLDRGVALGRVPANIKPDLDAYAAVTAKLGMQYVGIERFTVNDEHQFAGTPDRLISIGGVVFIGDLKSGDSAVDYPHSIAVQMACYANSLYYDIETGARTPLPAGLNREVGLLIHVKSGSGEAAVYSIDLKGGWEAALLSVQARSWLKRKDLTKELVTA